MKKSIVFAYTLAALLCGWAIISGNMEFVIYGITAIVLVSLVYLGDRKFNFVNWTLWAFNIWLISHILGGLFVIGDHALYSQMVLPLVGAPYDILKYDQIVHAYCYFVIALLLWQVLRPAIGDGHERTLMFFVVLAAIGVGGVNEMIEFSATVLVPDVNVGGYVNNAIDLICNSIGALIAIPFARRLPR